RPAVENITHRSQPQTRPKRVQLGTEHAVPETGDPGIEPTPDELRRPPSRCETRKARDRASAEQERTHNAGDEAQASLLGGDASTVGKRIGDYRPIFLRERSNEVIHWPKRWEDLPACNHAHAARGMVKVGVV